MYTIITIDGPAGTGKSSVAKSLSGLLGYAFYSTGLVYRALGLHTSKLSVCSDSMLTSMLRGTVVEIHERSEFAVVTDMAESAYKYSFAQLKTAETSMLASKLGKIESLGPEIVQIVRASAPRANFVTEGRNTGSVIFTSAQLKVYLDASLQARQARTASQFGEENAQMLLRRDQQDSTRKFAPLCIPEGAFVLDTTELSLEDVVRTIYQNSLMI